MKLGRRRKDHNRRAALSIYANQPPVANLLLTRRVLSRLSGLAGPLDRTKLEITGVMARN